MSKDWPIARFEEFLTPNKRPYTLGPAQDADLVGMRLYGAGPFHRELKPAGKIRKKTHFVIRANDIIYNKLFAWKGTFGVVPPALDGMYVSDKFPTYALDETLVDRDYLRWYFKYPPLWEQARQMSTGSAALSKLTLNPPRFMDLTIPLPPLPEQKRIVAKIESLAGKIEEARGQSNRCLADYESLACSVRANAFENLVRRNHPQKLAGLIEMTSGKGLNRSSLDPTSDHAVYGGGGYVGQYSQYLYEDSKTVVGRVGARCGCVFVTEPKCWVTDNALVIVSISSRLDRDYLAYALKHLDLRCLAKQAAQPVISQGTILKQVVPVPPLDEQRHIAAHLDSLQAKVDELKALQATTTSELDALLQSILDKAFKGEL